MGDETIFKLDDKVQVTNLPVAVTGVVRSIWIDHMGAQFQVQYLDDTGRIQRGWFAAGELAPLQV